MRIVWNLLARNRNYRLLLGANLSSATGDWILNIGMTFYVYDITGSALASGAMLFVAMVPQLLFGSLAGVFVDRWDRRRTMTVTNLLLALTLVPLFVVHEPEQIWLVYVVVFAQGVLEQFFVPAESAMVPAVVPEADLVAANALNGQNRQLTRLIGPVLGGVLAATGGILLVAVVDLVSYLLAAALVAMLRDVDSRAPGSPAGGEAEGEVSRRGRLRREWAAGIGVCFGRRDLATIFTFRVMNGFGDGVLSVLLAPLVIGVLGADSAEYGTVLSTQAIGGIAGALAVAAVGARFRPRLLLGYGALVFGIVDLAIAIYPLALPELWPLFILICVVGAPAAAMFAGFNTIQQLRTPDEYRGRVFGAISTGWATAMVLGIVVASTLGDVVGIIAVISLQGIVHILAGPLVLARLESAPDTAPLVAESAR